MAAQIFLAAHQRLRLRQRVGQQLRVMTWQAHRGFFDRHEFNRNHAAALVQQLKIRMLAVGAGLAPQHGRGVERQRLAACIDTLAVAFHFQLLQKGRQAAQRAAVGGNAAAGEAVEVAVPDV